MALCGDFNCIIEVKEKLGGPRGSSLAPNYLRNLLFNLDAVDLGFSGAKFTWYNRGKGCVRERLDRGIANCQWRMAFPRASVHHLGAVNSNHRPLIIDTCRVDCFSPRPFYVRGHVDQRPSLVMIPLSYVKNNFILLVLCINGTKTFSDIVR